MSTRCMLAVCVLGGVALAMPCLQVEQTVRGIPGWDPERFLTQRLWIAQDKLRLDEAVPGGGGWAARYLMRIDKDPGVIYELLEPAAKTYRQWEELDNIQRDRVINECQIVEGIQRLPEAERGRRLAEQYLREDLAHVVEVKDEGVQRLTLGERQFECRHVLIVENGLTVLDAFVTDQIGRGLDYYRFYRQLGTFSDEVLAKAKEVKGFPLKVTLNVVTHRLKTFHTLYIQVKDVAETDLDAAWFELPPGWTKEEKALKEPCRWRLCDKMVETANPGGRFDFKTRRYYFCSPKCRSEFLNELKPILKRGGHIEELLEGKPQAGRTETTPKK